MTEQRLAAAYLAIRDEVRHANLQRRLEDVLAHARAEHPALAVDDVVFVEFLATRGALDACEVHAADLYLACAVAVRAPGAAARLEARCISQVAPAIVRIERSTLFVATIESRVRDQLIAGGRIADYAARGPLAAFVRVAAIREALGVQRAELERAAAMPEAPAAASAPRLDELSIDQLAWLLRIHREAAARLVTHLPRRGSRAPRAVDRPVRRRGTAAAGRACPRGRT